MLSNKLFYYALSFAMKYTYVVMLSWYALIFTSGLNANALSRATSAFDFPTCSLWNKNCRFKLLTSIVSKSIYATKME